MKKIKLFFQLLKQTLVEFFNEDSFFHGAALSYYTVFALVPMIYLALISFGQIIGETEVLKMIDELLKEQVGLEDSSGIMQFLQEADFEQTNVLMNVVGIIALLFSCTAILTSLRSSINDFYDIKVEIDDRKKRLLYTIGTKLVSILLLSVFAFLLLVMYIGETVLMSVINFIFGEMNMVETGMLVVLLNSFSVIMNGLLFTLIFKFVNDGYVPFKIAFGGGILTSVLLFAGQLLIKFYLENYFFGSKSGVAGTLLVLLVWMYYTSQIIFIGAKFTKVYADYRGVPIKFEGQKNALRSLFG